MNRAPQLVNRNVKHETPVLGSCQSTLTAYESPEDILIRRLLNATSSLMPLVDRIVRAAENDVTILIEGETGTGKTYLSRLIHELSPRSSHPLLTVACGSLADTLVASELFGHSKGSFTGACQNKDGKFTAVGQGTLLLDEIDTLSLENQAMLLHVIETGTFEPVGSNDSQKCRARVIVASNVDLSQAVRNKTFRADLYYRLSVMSLFLPPLRERPQDINSLIHGTLARFNQKYDRHVTAIHPAAQHRLESYPWPGNIRQLENALQHGVLVSNGPVLLLEHLPDFLQDPSFAAGSAMGPDYDLPVSETGKMLARQRNQFERDTILQALSANGNNRSKAAKMLGINRVTLYKKLRKLGLKYECPCLE